MKRFILAAVLLLAACGKSYEYQPVAGTQPATLVRAASGSEEMGLSVAVTKVNDMTASGDQLLLAPVPTTLTLRVVKTKVRDNKPEIFQFTPVAGASYHFEFYGSSNYQQVILKDQTGLVVQTWSYAEQPRMNLGHGM